MALAIDDKDETNEALLLHEMARQLRLCFDRRAQHLGLTRAQWRVLGVLRRHPGINQTQMADMLEIEPITLVRQLDRMCKAGWVERRPDPRDRRANLLYLGAKTKDIVGQMRKLSIGLRRDALAGFTEVEHGVLLSYLQRMKTNISQMAGKET